MVGAHYEDHYQRQFSGEGKKLDGPASGEPSGNSTSWDDLLRLAFEIGLSPPEFDNLTPREFELCLEGYTRQYKTAQYNAALRTALIVNCWVKKECQVTAKDICGFGLTEGDTTVDEVEATNKELRERLPSLFVDEPTVTLGDLMKDTNGE